MKSGVIIAMLSPLLAAAQVPQALLDTATIRIGEQARITLLIDPDPDQLRSAIEWPQLPDTIGKIEIVQEGPIDTLIGDGVQLSRVLKITSFDTGFWAIPPFIFKIDGQDHATAPLLLEVRGVELGSDPQLKDIKPIHEVPFNILHWSYANWYWIVLSIVLIAAAILYWRWWRARPEVPVEATVPTPTIPLHDRIIAQMRDLEKERLWQNGAHKEYHSRLTDLLRNYVEERYQVPALESTTDELIKELRVGPVDREQLTRLRNMLELSDMVKFAKFIPSPIDNEQILQNAIRFVQETPNTRPAVIDA